MLNHIIIAVSANFSSLKVKSLKSDTDMYEFSLFFLCTNSLFFFFCSELEPEQPQGQEPQVRQQKALH
jgi:hypothetical protein